MFNIFNLSPKDLESKLNDLNSKIRSVDSSFYTATREDWDYIFNLCKEIAEHFKEVRYPNKVERNNAWQKFIGLRNQAFDIKKNRRQNLSDKYYNELMDWLKSVDYDKLADFFIGELLSFGIMKTKANEIKSAGQELRRIAEYYKKVKYEMTKDHSYQVQQRIIEVKQHHNDFWGKYKSYQEEKAKAYELKKKAWEEKKKEHERKQKEWEHRKVEQDRKKREWEARNAEQERKKREWEARNAEYKLIKERKQREYEERQRERESRRNNRESRGPYRGGSRNKKGDGGCFITGSVCNALGKPDNCDELSLFREFRDSWLMNLVGGSEIIARYYKIAPNIVKAISCRMDYLVIYQDIWNNYLSDCYIQIKNGNYENAFSAYQKMVLDLENKYLSSSELIQIKIDK